MTEESNKKSRTVEDSAAAEKSGVKDTARRRLLKTVAYAAPVVFSFGMPRSGAAGDGQIKPACGPGICSDAMGDFDP